MTDDDRDAAVVPIQVFFAALNTAAHDLTNHDNLPPDSRPAIVERVTALQKELQMMFAAVHALEMAFDDEAARAAAEPAPAVKEVDPKEPRAEEVAKAPPIKPATGGTPVKVEPDKDDGADLIKGADALEDAIKDVAEGVRKSGLEPATSLKWTDSKVTEVLKNFITILEKHKNAFLKFLTLHHPRDVEAFEKRMNEQLEMLKTYCAHTTHTDKHFEDVLYAIVALQDEFEKILKEHEIWMEAEFAKKAITADVAEQLRKKYEKHYKMYKEIFDLLITLDPALKATVPSPSDVTGSTSLPVTSATTLTASPVVSGTGATDRTFTILAERIPLYRDVANALYEELERHELYRKQGTGYTPDEERELRFITYVQRIATLFAGLQFEGKPALEFFEAAFLQLYLDTHNDRQVLDRVVWSDAFHAVYSITTKDDAQVFIEYTFIPRGVVDQEGQQIVEEKKTEHTILHDAFTDETIERLLSSYEWFLKDDRLFTLHVGKKRFETIKTQVQTLKTLLGQGDTAKPAIRSLVAQMQITFRAAMKEAHYDITTRLANTKKPKPRRLLSRDSDLVVTVERQLAELDQLIATEGN